MARSLSFGRHIANRIYVPASSRERSTAVSAWQRLAGRAALALMSCLAFSALAQSNTPTNCGSSSSVNLLDPSDQVWIDFNNTTNIDVFNATLTTNASEYTSLGGNFNLVAVWAWQNGNPQVNSPSCSMRILVNNIEFSSLTTPSSNGNTATLTSSNGALLLLSNGSTATSAPVVTPNPDFSNLAPFQTWTVILPTTVTSVTSVSGQFSCTSTAANGDDLYVSLNTLNACTQANLSVTKTNGASTQVTGNTTSYTVTVNNNGPSDASGAFIRDPAATGLSCTSITCSANGGAACPSGGDLSIVTLQGSPGVVIPTLPRNSSLTFNIGCQVTASGT